LNNHEQVIKEFELTLVHYIDIIGNIAHLD